MEHRKPFTRFSSVDYFFFAYESRERKRVLLRLKESRLLKIKTSQNSKRTPAAATPRLATGGSCFCFENQTCSESLRFSSPHSSVFLMENIKGS